MRAHIAVDDALLFGWTGNIHLWGIRILNFCAQDY